MNIVKKLWSKVEVYVMVLLFLGFLINVSVQIISRFAFNNPLPFTEEISRLFFIWMVFLGLSYATKYDKHIRVSFIVNAFPQKLQIVIDILISLLTFTIFSYLFYIGIKYVKYTSVVTTPALQINKGITTTIIPLCSFLMILRTAEKIIQKVKKLFPSKVREPNFNNI